MSERFRAAPKIALLLGWLALALLVASAPASVAAARSPLKLVAKRGIDPRLSELQFQTPEVSGETGVRVLIPSGYAGSHRRYPVLYLLHGCCNGSEGYRTWTDKLDAEEITAGQRLIVVMPDSGPGGGYINWWNGGAGGPPQWETYHVGELIPWVDAHYRTIAKRRGRAIAGLSMGGFGALTYAARHPDMFVAASAYSGAVDLNVVTPALNAIGGGDDRASGPYDTEQVRTRAVNPWDLAANLRGMRLALRTGNGRDSNGNLVDIVESVVHAANVSLHDRLDDLGLAHVWDDYGPGTHTGPYWTADLRRDLPGIMDAFRNPPRAPRRVTFKAAEPRYQAYGWRVRIKRRAMEFSRLVDAGRSGFTLVGSGSAVVRTPSLYRPGSRHVVAIRGGGTIPRAKHPRREAVSASRRGSLHVRLRLGPANPFQEYTPQERAAPDRFYRAGVSVRPGG